MKTSNTTQTENHSETRWAADLPEKRTREDQAILYRLSHRLRSKGRHDGTLSGLKDLFERRELMTYNYFSTLNI